MDLINVSDADENGDMLDVDDDSSEYDEFLDDKQGRVAEMQDEIDERGVVFIASELTATFGKLKLSSILPAPRYVPLTPIYSEVLCDCEVGNLKASVVESFHWWQEDNSGVEKLK